MDSVSLSSPASTLPITTPELRVGVWVEAERRVKARATCGKRGYVAVYRQKATGRLVYRFVPIRCKSVLCPYCAWRESKKRLKAIRNLLEAVREPVGFLTLSFSSFDNPIDAVSYALRVKRKFYNFRLFGRKKWAKVKQRALELLEAYLRHIEDEREREKKRRFHLWTIQKFEEVWVDQLYNSNTKLYMGRILRSVWKLEMTYNSRAGWHPHFHVLVIGYFPLFVLQAVWTACGGGEVIDMRLAKSVDAVAEYVSDYESKPVMDLEEGQDLSHELQVALEASLYGRRVFEVWGLAELERRVEGGYELVAVARGVRCELELDNLHELPRLVRQLRGQSRDGPTVMFLCWAMVSVCEWFDGEVVEFKAKAGAFLDSDGRIWLVGDERFEELVNQWACGLSRGKAKPDGF